MRRIQGIEIEDQSWCPAAIRDAMTDYLAFVVDHAQPYRAVAARLNAAIRRTRARRVIDLGSGGAGPWRTLAHALDPGVRVRLTDRYPNVLALERARVADKDRLEFEAAPVDALAVPDELDGFRTLFSSFHHFPPEGARAILASAVRAGEGIGVFELVQRRPIAVLQILPAPLLVLLTTPFVRPFRWSRLFWTYVLPAVPLFILWDGVVSCMRAYTETEMRTLTAGLDGHCWEIGEEKANGLLRVAYLIGTPRALGDGEEPSGRDVDA